jgi:hypothetical protein
MPSVSFTFAPSGLGYIASNMIGLHPILQYVTPSGLMIVTQALKGRIMPRMGAVHLGEPEDARSPSTSPSIAYSPSI